MNPAIIIVTIVLLLLAMEVVFLEYLTQLEQQL